MKGICSTADLILKSITYWYQVFLYERNWLKLNFRHHIGWFKLPFLYITGATRLSFYLYLGADYTRGFLKQRQRKNRKEKAKQDDTSVVWLPSSTPFLIVFEPSFCLCRLRCKTLWYNHCSLIFWCLSQRTLAKLTLLLIK